MPPVPSMCVSQLALDPPHSSRQAASVTLTPCVTLTAQWTELAVRMAARIKIQRAKSVEVLASAMRER
jgi:hypothetical protein